MSTAAVLAETSAATGQRIGARLQVDIPVQVRGREVTRANSTSHSSLRSLKEVGTLALNDRDNPHNWSNRQESFVVFNEMALICLHTEYRSLF